MKTIKIVLSILMLLSVSAGTVISVWPVNACNHSIGQMMSILVLSPSLLAASLFMDVNTWDFQRHSYVLGIAQALVLLLVVAAMNARTKKPNNQIQNIGTNAPTSDL